jgi:hypothetical protein
VFVSAPHDTARCRGSIVSCTFDDFPRRAYLVGAPILEACGGRGTLLRHHRFPEHMRWTGRPFPRRGPARFGGTRAGVGYADVSSSSSRRVSLAEFQNDVHKGIREFERLVDRHSVKFCYPYGHVTLGTERHLESVISRSERHFPGINGPEIDLNLLRANRLYGDMFGAPGAAIDPAKTPRRRDGSSSILTMSGRTPASTDVLPSWRVRRLGSGPERQPHPNGRTVAERNCERHIAAGADVENTAAAIRG